MSLARVVRRALILGALTLSVLAVPRADAIVTNPPWGWHVSNEAEAIIGMFIVPLGAILISGMFSILPALPPGDPVQTGDWYEWRVTIFVATLLLVHVWALMPVFGIYLI